MKSKILVLLCVGITVFILFGCTTAFKNDKPRETSGGVLEAQALAKFSDIPVPAGFKFLPQESYCFENSGLRVGLLKYEGRVDIEKLVSFYKEQMSMYNWRLLNVVEYGERLLNFDRDQETCIISLLPRGKQVTLIVSLGPKAQFSKKPEKPIK